MTQNISSTDIQNQAKIALYLAAKEAAEVLKLALIETESNDEYIHKGEASVYMVGEKRIAVAIEVLKIAWNQK